MSGATVSQFPRRDVAGGFAGLASGDGWVPAADLPPDAINARRYLKGDGTDDTTRLNNLLTAAAGGAIVIPGHTDYYVPGQIVVPDAAIQVVMQKGGRFTRNVNDRLWMIGGGTKTVFAGGVLVANSAAGARALAITDASSISAGDRFILRSSLTWPGSTGGKYGEQVRVLAKNSAFTANTSNGSPNLTNISNVASLAPGSPVSGSGIAGGTMILSVDTGSATAVMSANASATASTVTITPSNTVTLYGPTQEVYTTADTARLDKANLREGQHFEGLVFEGVANSGGYGAIDLDLLLAPQFRSLTFRNLDGPGLQLNSALAARGWAIDGFDLQDNVGAGRFGYLDNLNGACQGCVIAGGYSERVRHHVTTNGDANGVPHNNDFIGLKGRYATTTDFDEHEDGRGNRFIGCESRGSQGAFKVRAPDTELIGCAASGFLTEGLNVASTALRSAARAMRIWDNRGTSQSLIVAPDDFEFEGSIDNLNAGTAECALVTGNGCHMEAHLRRPGGGSANCMTLNDGTSGHVLDVFCEDAAKGVFFGSGTTAKHLRVRDRNLSSHFVDGGPFTNGALAATITVGASPYIWTNTTGIDVDLIISGGTVSSIDRSNDGSSFTFIGAVTAGTFRVAPGASLRVAYSAVPTMKFIPVRG